MAEHDIASASRYRLLSDGTNLGLFKSSGLIVATGTGSSGWLFAARQLIPQKVSEIVQRIGSDAQCRYINEQISNVASKQTTFGSDQHRFFYFVREGFANTKRTEGFTEDLQIVSEMLTGELVVDGWMNIPLNLGEPIHLQTAGSELSLTDLQLIFD